MHRFVIVGSLLLLGLFGCVAAERADPRGAPARVLILTGEDRHHDWPATTPVLTALLEADPRLGVEVLDDLSAIAAADLEAYEVVVVHFKNDDPAVPGRAAFDRIVRYVEQGGGLVLVHFACGAFQEFRDEWEALVGRVWFGLEPPPGGRQHDPYGEFEVRPTSVDHPITRRLTAFSTTDELYTCLVGDTPVQVIADAVSPVDSITYPMTMVRTPGKGRVFLCTLGHDVAAYRAAGVMSLYRRGTAWCAGLTPTPPTLDPAE